MRCDCHSPRSKFIFGLLSARSASLITSNGACFVCVLLFVACLHFSFATRATVRKFARVDKFLRARRFTIVRVSPSRISRNRQLPGILRKLLPLGAVCALVKNYIHCVWARRAGLRVGRKVAFSIRFGRVLLLFFGSASNPPRHQLLRVCWRPKANFLSLTHSLPITCVWACLLPIHTHTEAAWVRWKRPFIRKVNEEGAFLLLLFSPGELLFVYPNTCVCTSPLLPPTPNRIVFSGYAAALFSLVNTCGWHSVILRTSLFMPPGLFYNSSAFFSHSSRRSSFCLVRFHSSAGKIATLAKYLSATGWNYCNFGSNPTLNFDSIIYKVT